jgi:hypothetical protein
MGSFRLKDAADHLKAGIPQALNATTSDAGIGIGEAHHHPLDARSDHGIGTGGRAAVVTTGFEGDHDRAAAGGIPGLGQGAHLGMGLPSAGMKAFAHELAGWIKHHRSHKGIRAGVAFRQGR